jgi:signal transduction histidine kinase/HAMP domain-containing protein
MNFKFNISKRIAIGYSIILLIATIASVVSILRLQINRKQYNEISEVYSPSISYLKEYEALSKESNKLIINWIYISNKEEKERLKTIVSRDYPDLKLKMNQFSNSHDKDEMKREQLKLLEDYDSIISLQRKIMANLPTAKQYESDSLVDASMTILEKEIKPRYNANQVSLNNLLKIETDNLKQVEGGLDKSLAYLTLTMIIMLALILIIGTIASYLATNSITKPFKGLKDIILSLSKGEIPLVEPTKREDEIGEMTNAIAAMTESISLKAEFATETGIGNYNKDFKLLSNKDILGLALVQMRDNLHRVAKEDSGRNWLNDGLAKVSELLRINNDEEEQMYSDIINFLSEYVDGVCGALFIINDKDKNDTYLELGAGYALELKAYEKKKIHIGEGLTGQAVAQKKIMVIENVPEGFVKISSGLGEATPKTIIIIPLIFENEVKGVIEIASVGTLTDLQKEFLEKSSKNIAIAVDLISRKARTENLLIESRQLNEKLKLNEVELKTANEELSTFVYRASHDLRGPLSSILGLVYISTAEKLEKKGEHYMQMVGESANKLDRILNVLIKTMSINEGVLKIDKVDFKSMIDSLVENLKNQNEVNRTKFVTDIEVEADFYSDYEILNYALNNIIENAVKFQNHSIPESFILIGINSIDKGVKITISDNGKGVKKELQGKLFEMFFRGDTKTSGSGLGLYLVKKAITKLGGKIEFVSEEGAGTFVSIMLPNLSVIEIEQSQNSDKYPYLKSAIG